MRGINELISLLANHTVNGILFDRNTYYHFNSRTHEKKYQYIAQRLQSIDMMKTEKVLAQDTLSAGILVKKYEDFKYFESYLNNNLLSLRSCNSIRMNMKDTETDGDVNLFDPEGGLFLSVLIVLVAIVGGMVVIGICVEGRRYYVHVKGDEEEK